MYSAIDVEEVPPVDAELKREIQQQQAAQEVANAKFADPSSDLKNMAPKKLNWDLKRAVEPKLNILQKRTQEALLELARERLAASGGGDKLASAVANASRLSSDDDEEE